MAITNGINHLGLAVKNLKETTDFFTVHLGWEESGYDAKYPRTSVTDGNTRLTLWQTDESKNVTEFNRRENIGLHHLAFEVELSFRLN